MTYKERIFWRYPDDEIRKFLRGKCPLNSFIGNQNAVDMLRAIAFQAWQNPNHATLSKSTGKAEKINIALLGGAGLGKTTLAKLFAKTLLLPFVELAKVRDVQQIFDAIRDELHNSEIPLTTVNDIYVSPPCVVFVDEVHNLASQARKSPKGIMNDFLKATEPDDSRLVKQGEWVLDCTNICWVVATTEWFILPKPFRERFEKIELTGYTTEEATKIVSLRFPTMPQKVARMAAEYGRNIPRLAIGYAKSFNLEKGYQNVSWEKAAEMVASKKGIDEYGMDRDSIQILTILGKSKYTSTNKLANYCGKNEIELVEMILPPLVNPPNSEPLIRHTKRGWTLLDTGIEELKKRKISFSKELNAA